jgi:hypothetical protein
LKNGSEPFGLPKRMCANWLFLCLEENGQENYTPGKHRGVLKERKNQAGGQWRCTAAMRVLSVLRVQFSEMMDQVRTGDSNQDQKRQDDTERMQRGR